MSRPSPDDLSSTDAVDTRIRVELAGLLTACVMVGHLSLTDEPACRRAICAAGVDMDALAEDTFRAAWGTAVRMIEDRARRAVAYVEPRR